MSPKIKGEEGVHSRGDGPKQRQRGRLRARGTPVAQRHAAPNSVSLPQKRRDQGETGYSLTAKSYSMRM